MPEVRTLLAAVACSTDCAIAARESIFYLKNDAKMLNGVFYLYSFAQVLRSAGKLCLAGSFKMSFAGFFPGGSVLSFQKMYISFFQNHFRL